ncbi:hypothetical protein BD311DRAFT_563544 [Dichomitus squalens]|uniref:Uncharacterized protein n=1 Tax=Dichomitus squalens TaxID=114155 RepID=A0A4V2JZB2_9APHY|nr:hypothetical protein BD311DRAFT_563544 [Dichomitus squalens]
MHRAVSLPTKLLSLPLIPRYAVSGLISAYSISVTDDHFNRSPTRHWHAVIDQDFGQAQLASALDAVGLPSVGRIFLSAYIVHSQVCLRHSLQVARLPRSIPYGTPRQPDALRPANFAPSELVNVSIGGNTRNKLYLRMLGRPSERADLAGVLRSTLLQSPGRRN